MNIYPMCRYSQIFKENITKTLIFSVISTLTSSLCELTNQLYLLFQKKLYSAVF